MQRRGETVVQGPYYVLQRHQHGRNQSQRVSDQEVDLIAAHVLAYKRYLELAGRFASLTEAATWDHQPQSLRKKFRRFWRPASRKRRPS